MAIQSQPSRISEPFAGSGTKNTIPAANAAPSASQAASWASGFPPECSQPISAGGCPVPRNDMNGVLNQLSQDFAFRQDGGIWAWSASADYDIGRIVRGSDGLLYQSVAQSGPGLAAGAQNPTTDGGTYWSSPSLKTMPMGDRSNAGATTEWVKDLAAAPVYLSPSGSDSNDGMTAATAVKTFAKAAQIAMDLPQDIVVLKAAAGTYTGDLSIRTQNLSIELAGNATFNGTMNIEAGYVEVLGSGTLTIACSATEYAVRLIGGATLDFKCAVSVNAAVSGDVFVCQYNCNLYFGAALSITANADGSAFYVSQAYCEFFDTVSISGTKVARIVLGLNSSGIIFDKGVSVTDIVTAEGIHIEGNSLCYLTTPSGSTSTIRDGSSAYGSILVYSGSALFFAGAGTCSIYHKGQSWGSCIRALEGVVIVNSALSLTSSACEAFISSSNGSDVRLETGSCSFSGTASEGTVNCNFGSMLTILSGVTLSGSPTGPRFSVSWNSTIFTQSGGPNRIPGSADGTIYSSLYGLYG